MKIQSLIFLILLFAGAGCGSRVSQIDKNGTSGHQQNPPLSSPAGAGGQRPETAVQHNRSEITGEIVKINEHTDSSFTVVLRVLEITEDSSYPSIAVKDNVYELWPGFVLDEKNIIADTQKNKNLLLLKNRKKGDLIHGVIFLSGGNKWIIKDLSE